MTVRLPDGTTIQRSEVLASVGPHGLVATYPLPENERYKPGCTYLLACGISVRDGHAVDRSPDPVGCEGRDQDGVHTTLLGGGARWETTFRNGVPDGPFRSYNSDGSLSCEATYIHGRLTGPAWRFPGDGTRYDELNPNPFPENTARQKLNAGDFAGAVKDFDSALLNIVPSDGPVSTGARKEPTLLRGRSEALLRLGKREAALADLRRARDLYQLQQVLDQVEALDVAIAKITGQPAPQQKPPQRTPQPFD
jgi:hypothetical protein